MKFVLIDAPSNLGLRPLIPGYEPFNRCRYRCRCRNRFGGTYTTYETDRTNEQLLGSQVTPGRNERLLGNFLQIALLLDVENWVLAAKS
jgi:hypothetical protein